MKKLFGTLRQGGDAFLYTISRGGLTAEVSDYGATLVKLWVPDRQGELADVVLGFDDPNDYTASGTFFGATVGRNANRIAGAAFRLNGLPYLLDANDNGKNNHHGGFRPYKNRLWKVLSHEEDRIRLGLESPNGDQGFPGNADISVTYRLDAQAGLHILFEAVCDHDTVFNMTNHSYFNLAGHDKTDRALSQELILPGRFYVAADADSIPTGELRSVEGTPLDFRRGKAIGNEINADYEALTLQLGYDHTWEVWCDPCAILTDEGSGRSMSVSTDCPGIHLYTGNYIDGENGKGGVIYPYRGGIALETQFYPDAIHHPQWPQPITKAGEKYRSETVYRFK